jgi:hypothetical protein
VIWRIACLRICGVPFLILSSRRMMRRSRSSSGDRPAVVDVAVEDLGKVRPVLGLEVGQVAAGRLQTRELAVRVAAEVRGVVGDREAARGERRRRGEQLGDVGANRHIAGRRVDDPVALLRQQLVELGVALRPIARLDLAVEARRGELLGRRGASRASSSRRQSEPATGVAMPRPTGVASHLETRPDGVTLPPGATGVSSQRERRFFAEPSASSGSTTWTYRRRPSSTAPTDRPARRRPTPDEARARPHVEACATGSSGGTVPDGASSQRLTALAGRSAIGDFRVAAAPVVDWSAHWQQRRRRPLAWRQRRRARASQGGLEHRLFEAGRRVVAHRFSRPRR